MWGCTSDSDDELNSLYDPIELRYSEVSEVKSLSRVWLFATPWTAAHQAPPSMGFSRQEYWSGVPSPSLATQLDIVFM